MAKTFTEMQAGFATTFLANATLTAEIEDRFWELGDPHMIATFESLAEEPASSHGKFVIYRDAGETTRRLKGGRESLLRFARLEIDCYGKYPPDARSLREIVLATVGMGVSATWGGVTIKNAHWDTDGQSMGFDETAKMSFARCVLIVPYLNN